MRKTFPFSRILLQQCKSQGRIIKEGKLNEILKKDKEDILQRYNNYGLKECPKIPSCSSATKSFLEWTMWIIRLG